MAEVCTGDSLVGMSLFEAITVGAEDGLSMRCSVSTKTIQYPFFVADSFDIGGECYQPGFVPVLFGSSCILLGRVSTSNQPFIGWPWP